MKTSTFVNAQVLAIGVILVGFITWFYPVLVNKVSEQFLVFVIILLTAWILIPGILLFTRAIDGDL